MWVGVGVGLTYISDILAGEIVIVIVGHVGPRPRIFLAILPDSKQVQFFQFGIGIVFLTSNSKKRIELLKSDSMRLYESLWYCIFGIRIIFLICKSKNSELDLLGVA